MTHLLWLIPTLPLAGFVALVAAGLFARGALSPKVVAIIGVGAVAASAVVAGVVAWGFVAGGNQAHDQFLWRWISAAELNVSIGLHIDALSMLMVLVVTFVAMLIHIYSAAFMSGDEGYGRFFAYMNLFVASMLTLVLADNLLLLYLGWEGVGLCSYLLIGFWYKDPANGRAAMKAFIVTRIGDTALAIALAMLLWNFGTLDIQTLLARLGAAGDGDRAIITAIGLLLLGGAVGKSAQLPLQTWLPDAMAGPTPTSALIHAATMVTAGVYLIARMHVVFDVSAVARLAVAAGGAATLVIAGFSALAQRDIKRVLAYSTVSQIGYMFLALGVGAYSAAMFHFMTHAFFKSLLFLAAGVVILAMRHEHDMFKMGGLRKSMPLVFWTFVAGGCSLAALPLVTAGFYSKEAILSVAAGSGDGGMVLWAAGVVGALLTSLYTFRMIFITFCGPAKQEPAYRPGAAMTVPLVVLAGLSIVGGFVQTPQWLGDISEFSRWMAGPYGQAVLPQPSGEHLSGAAEMATQLAAMGASLAGIAIAYGLFRRRTNWLFTGEPVGALGRLWLAGCGFDWVYDRLLVRPIVWLARVGRNDVVDLVYRGVAGASLLCNGVLTRLQTGRVRWYAAGVAVGVVVVIAIVVAI